MKNYKVRKGSSTKKFTVYLEKNELALMEARAKSENRSVSGVISELVQRELSSESSGSNPNQTQSHLKLESLEERFGKLERILRSLMINTANIRGFALALGDAQQDEVAQNIKDRMKKIQEEQKEFFFGIYPDQRPKN
jgi:predicted CopG family antitoxin